MKNCPKCGMSTTNKKKMKVYGPLLCQFCGYQGKQLIRTKGGSPGANTES